MKDILFNLYLKSPNLLKRLLGNIESIRRDLYRKSNNKNFDIQLDIDKQEDYFNQDRISKLLNEACENVPYYKFLSNYDVKSCEDFEKIPLLTKQFIRNYKEEIISKTVSNKRQLWSGSSSGSTGMPLSYYRDKNSVSIERANYNKYYEYNGFNVNENRIRISGVKVATFDRKKPPYWIYIDRYKQLQCSAYHILQTTFKDYLNEFSNVNASFATGYPSAWTSLSELMINNNITFNNFKAIVTDSEGLSDINKAKIEKAFNCPVYKTYGLSEVGMCAVECKKGHYHILPSHYVEVVDDNGHRVNDGEVGQIVVTDYNSHKYPFIRYATGDLGIMYHKNCGCGLNTPYLSEITGRIEDYILTKDGRKITRLTLIMKPAVGVKESQIVQNSIDGICINIVPDKDFDPKSMTNVIENAKQFLGDMNIEWNIVEHLQRMPSGKVKFLIRKI